MVEWLNSISGIKVKRKVPGFYSWCWESQITQPVNWQTKMDALWHRHYVLVVCARASEWVVSTIEPASVYQPGLEIIRTTCSVHEIDWLWETKWKPWFPIDITNTQCLSQRKVLLSPWIILKSFLHTARNIMLVKEYKTSNFIILFFFCSFLQSNIKKLRKYNWNIRISLKSYPSTNDYFN